jgi:hypothetical protein
MEWLSCYHGSKQVPYLMYLSWQLCVLGYKEGNKRLNKNMNHCVYFSKNLYGYVGLDGINNIDTPIIHLLQGVPMYRTIAISILFSFSNTFKYYLSVKKLLHITSTRKTLFSPVAQRL